MNEDLILQRCALCHGSLEYHELGLGLTDPEIGPGMLHQVCSRQLIFAGAWLRHVGLKECRRIQR
jgi:hypothetical protein